MKSKIKKKHEPDNSKFKNLKSIKKTKKHENTKKVLKNLKKELKASALDKENKFSQFVKQYNGASLDAGGQQLLQFINEKNLFIPKRKKKFLNMVKSCIGEKVLLTEDQKISFFETIKSDYLSFDGKINAISKKTVTDQDGFTMFVGKKKKKKLQKQLENNDEQFMDTSADALPESNQIQELDRKRKKKKNRLATSDETFTDTSTGDIQMRESNVTKTKERKNFEKNSQNTTNIDNVAATETVTKKNKKIKDGKKEPPELNASKNFAGEELLKIKQYVKEKAKAKEITKGQKGQIQKHMKKLKTKNVI